MQREPVEPSGFVKDLWKPVVRLRRGPDVAQYGTDVNRLAVVAAMVFAKLLHAENIMQLVAPKCNEGGSCQDAKKYLTRISRINTGVLTTNHAKYANGLGACTTKLQRAGAVQDASRLRWP